MKFDKKLSADENLISIDRTSFGYSVTHRRGDKTKFTASYVHKADAVRTATKMAQHLQSQNEAVWYCLNYAFDSKKKSQKSVIK